jgi:hypothetical protein
MIKSQRRFTPRLNLKVPLRFLPGGTPGKPEHTGESVNLSAQGVFFITDRPPQVRELIYVSFSMPQEITGRPPTEYQYVASVAHRRLINPEEGKYGVGVKLLCYADVEPTAG